MRKSKTLPSILKVHTRKIGLALAAVATTLSLSSVAQTNYPDQTITLIIPFPAGSGTDSVGRVFAEEMSKRLNQTVIVENKPGANATIAAQYVARAKPDGYTLFLTTNTSHSAAPWLMKNINYDPIKDFTPIARGGNLPFILVTNPQVPYQSAQELIEYAKKNPGKVTYASGNSTGIVAGGTLGHKTDIEILHIPYKGTPQALTDLSSGQVDFMFTDVTSGSSFISSGRIKPLAVSTVERSELLPDLPSMEESGVPDFDITSWNGLFGPANLPQEITIKLNKTINEIVEDSEAKAKLARLGFDAFSGSSEDFSQFVSDQYQLWGKLIEDANLAPQ